MVKRLASITLLLLAGSLPALAHIPPDLRGSQIVEVRVEGGSENLGSLREIGIPSGAPLTRSLIRNVISRLLRTGRWSDVQVDAERVPRGVRLVVRLTPRFLVERVVIEGNSEVSEKLIASAVEMDMGSRVSHQDLYTLAGKVKRVYADRGYLGAEVQVGLRDTAEVARKVVVVGIREGEPTRVSDISFSGDKPPDPGFAISALGIGVGDVLDRRLLSEGVKQYELQLRRRGYFEAEMGSPLVSIGRRGASLEIPCSIGPRYRLDIRGFQPLERSTVKEAMQIEQQALTADGALEAMRGRVLDLYARHGYLAAEVRIDRAPATRPKRATLRVRIEPGEQITIVAVNFPGARHFDRDYLSQELFVYLEEDLPGSTFVSPVDDKAVDDLTTGSGRRLRREVPAPPETDPRRIYYPPTYQEAIKHMGELYQADGFLSASVGPAQIEHIDRNRAAVAIPVVEGPRTLLHGVVLKGNRLLGARELLSAAGLEREMPFSYLRMEEARLRLVKLYQEEGYLFVEVEPSVRFSPDNTRAEMVIQVDEGFPVYVEEIVIRGARHTSEYLIRSLSLLEPGNLYRPSLARETEERLLSLGVFSGVKVEPEDPELAAPVKRVLIMVTERPLQLLNFSAGVSTGQGLRTGFEYGYRNLFGQAVSTSLRVQFAYRLFLLTEEEVWRRFKEQLTTFGEQLERRVTLSTFIPHIPGLTGVRTTIDLIYLRNIERDFVLDTTAVALTFGYPLARRLMVTLGSGLENNYVKLFDAETRDEYMLDLVGDPDAPRLLRLLRVPDGDSTLLSAHASLTYDQRDNPFVPTRGYRTSVRTEWARTLESAEIDTEPFVSRFIKASVSTSGYLPLGRSVVLAGQVRAGSIFHLSADSETYPNRAFYLGGVDTIRGYFQDAMMPQDTADEILQHNKEVEHHNEVIERYSGVFERLQPAGEDETVPRLQKWNPNAFVRSADLFLLLRGEIRFPIVGQLHGGLFTDLGNLWADPYGRLPDSRPVELYRLRPSAGAGIRLATPVGPLALDYGILLDRRKELDEPFGTLHFSIGLF